jgi:hypothetical protein
MKRLISRLCTPITEFPTNFTVMTVNLADGAFKGVILGCNK